MSSRSLPEIARLLHRDDIVQKHADKSRLREEVASGVAKLATAAPPSVARKAKTKDSRILMLVQHLLQAGRASGCG